MEAYVVKDIRLEDEYIYVAFSDIYISFNSMSIMMVFVLRKPLSGLTANKLHGETRIWIFLSHIDLNCLTLNTI